MIRLFRVFIPASTVALALSEIVLIYLCFVLAAFMVLEVDPEYFLIFDGGLLRITVAVVSISISLYFQDLYDDLRILSRIRVMQQFLMAIGIAFLVQAISTYVSQQLILPRWMMIYASLLIVIAVPIWRTVFVNLVLTGDRARLVLFMGTSPVLAELNRRLHERIELGFRVIGYIDDRAVGATTEGLEGVKCLGKLSALRAIVEKHKPERIVVGMSERRARLPVYDLLDLRLSGIHVEEAAVLYESCFGRVSTRDLRPSQLIFSSELGPSANSVAMQHLYSFAIAAAGAVLTSPLMLLAALFLKLTSKGPVLYKQVRVGKDGANFHVLKFRSMYVDAEARTGAVWASKNDPRITPVGRYLRKFRIDELPQFWNVLRGDMSFVGPRPERPEFVQALSEKIPFYRQRHCVRPGITGWAQINHKYGDTVEDTITKLEYDLYYIKNISFALDVYIILNTLKTVLLGRGAQ